MGQKEDMMNKRSKLFLTVLLCVAFVGNTGCTSTTYRVGASQAAMHNYGIGNGDSVLVRYSNKNDPRSSSRSELIQINRIGKASISGIGEKGNAVNVGYDEIFQIEVKGKSSAIKSDNAALMGASKATGEVLEVVGRAALVALYIASGGAP